MNADASLHHPFSGARGWPLSVTAPDLQAAPRYRIDYLPAPETSLAQLASAWFGCDLHNGTPCPRIALPGFDGIGLHRLAAAPGGQRFRCGLNDAFELASRTSEAELLDNARRFAEVHRPFSVWLEVAECNGTLGLGLGAPSESMAALQQACARSFVRFAATPSSLAPRRSRLRRQPDANNFQFHLNLTARIPSNTLRRKVKAQLQALFARELEQCHRVDGISVGIQVHGGSVSSLRRFEFGS